MDLESLKILSDCMQGKSCPYNLENLIIRAQELVLSQEGIAMSAGTAATALTAALTNHFQQKEANVLPSLLSGSRKLHETNSALEFYAAVNDICMTVTQAWNKCREQKSYSAFQSELSKGGIETYLSHMQNAGKKLETDLEMHENLRSAAAEAGNTFSSSWYYHSEDNYITVPVVHTVSNGKGGTTTSVSYERRYSDTDHYFDFHAEKAKTAQKMLEELLEKYRPEKLYNPDFNIAINPDIKDIEAIKKTIFEDEKKTASAEELKDIFTQWASKSKANATVKQVSKDLAHLIQNSKDMLSAISASEQHYHFNTASTMHEGPAGYQASESLKDKCWSISESIGALQSSISEATKEAEYFRKLSGPRAENFLMKDGQKQKSPKSTAKRSLATAVNLYEMSFPESRIKIDQRARAQWTVLIALGAGALTGIGTYLLQQYLR